MERKQTPDSLESISKACDEAEDLLAALDESDQQKKAGDQRQNIPIEQNNTSITKSKTTKRRSSWLPNNSGHMHSWSCYCSSD